MKPGGEHVLNKCKQDLLTADQQRTFQNILNPFLLEEFSLHRRHTKDQFLKDQFLTDHLQFGSRAPGMCFTQGS